MTKYRSKIFVKGEREARIVPSGVASAMKRDFDNDDVPGFHIVRGGSLSLRKDEIRLIEVVSDLSQPDGSHTSYWIIYNHARRAIWSTTFSTYAAAKAEFDFQVMTLPPEAHAHHGWAIEERQSRNKRD